MPMTLQDPILDRDPASRHAFPELRREAELRAPRTLAEELLAWFRSGALRPRTTFQLASHGGYARSVTGTVSYLDDEAQTFMVLDGDGRLNRVPLRDVTSTHAAELDDGNGRPSEPDVTGLGTGEDRSLSASV
jgi:hypothetical protein